MAEITRDALLARRAQLADEEKLAWANLNAVLGAQQDIDYWLARLAEPVEVPGSCGGCGAEEGQLHEPLCRVVPGQLFGQVTEEEYMRERLRAIAPLPAANPSLMGSG